MIRAEVQQQMGAPLANTLTCIRQRPAQNFPTGDPVCINCGRRGHTYYNYRANPDLRVPRGGKKIIIVSDKVKTI